MKKYFALQNYKQNNKRNYRALESLGNTSNESSDSLIKNIPNSNSTCSEFSNQKLKPSSTYQNSLNELDLLCNGIKKTKISDPEGFYF